MRFEIRDIRDMDKGTRIPNAEGKDCRVVEVEGVGKGVLTGDTVRGATATSLQVLWCLDLAEGVR